MLLVLVWTSDNLHCFSLGVLQEELLFFWLLGRIWWLGTIGTDWVFLLFADLMKSGWREIVGLMLCWWLLMIRVFIAIEGTDLTLFKIVQSLALCLRISLSWRVGRLRLHVFHNDSWVPYKWLMIKKNITSFFWSRILIRFEIELVAWFPVYIILIWALVYIHLLNFLEFVKIHHLLGHGLHIFSLLLLADVRNKARNRDLSRWVLLP